MANIGSLYVSLGVDSKDLKVGLQKSQQTVGQFLTQMNQQTKNIKLETDFKIEGLGETAKEMDVLKLRAEGLAKQLEIAMKKASVSKQTAEITASKLGADSTTSLKRQQEAMLRAQDARKLEQALKQVNARMQELAVAEQKANAEANKLKNRLHTAFNQRFGTQIEAATNSFKGFSKGAFAVSQALASFSTAVSSMNGLKAVINGVVEKGEALYQMAGKMHVAASEAGKLTKELMLGGSSGADFANFYKDIDKMYLKGGEKWKAYLANSKVFGMDLFDEQEQLKKGQALLDELAKGYAKAKQNGMDSEFTDTMLIGNKYQGLETTIDELNKIKAIMSEVKGNGFLDANQLHETYMQMKALEMTAGGMKDLIAYELAPIALEVAPQLNKSLGAMVDTIKDNKEAILQFGKTAASIFGELLKSVADIIIGIGNIAKGFKDITGGTDYNKKIVEKIEQNTGKKNSLSDKQVLNDPVNKLLYGAWDAIAPSIDLQFRYNKNEIEQAKKDLFNETYNKPYADTKPTEANTKNDINVGDLYAAQKEAQAKQEAQIKATEAVRDEIYQATHSEYQNKIHDINNKVDTLINKEGVDTDVAEELRKVLLEKAEKEENDKQQKNFESWASEFKSACDTYQQAVKNFQDAVDNVGKAEKNLAKAEDEYYRGMANNWRDVPKSAWEQRQEKEASAKEKVESARKQLQEAREKEEKARKEVVEAYFAREKARLKGNSVAGQMMNSTDYANSTYLGVINALKDAGLTDVEIPQNDFSALQYNMQNLPAELQNALNYKSGYPSSSASPRRLDDSNSMEVWRGNQKGRDPFIFDFDGATSNINNASENIINASEVMENAINNASSDINNASSNINNAMNQNGFKKITSENDSPGYKNVSGLHYPGMAVYQAVDLSETLKPKQTTDLGGSFADKQNNYNNNNNLQQQPNITIGNIDNSIHQDNSNSVIGNDMLDNLNTALDTANSATQKLQNSITSALQSYDK